MQQESKEYEDEMSQHTTLVQTGLNSWVLQTFRSLRSRNYRIYATSQLISNCGSWIQLTAISWLVFEISGSAFLLGLVSFLRQSPLLLFGFAGGWLADHVDRKKILVWTKVAMLIQAVILFVLTYTDSITIWHMLVLATCLGIVNSIDMPAKQSFTFTLVDRKDLVNAVSLNTSSFHASRTLGPVLAISVVALLGARKGEATCFLLNALSYLGVIYALIKIQPAKQVESQKKEKKEVGFKKAIDFALQTPSVKRVLILGATSSFFCMQYLVMLPVVSKEVLGKAIGGYGFLLAAAALGSFLAAMILANKGKEGKQLENSVNLAALGFGVGLTLFSLSHTIYLSFPIAVLLGFCSTSQLSGSNSLIQLMVDDNLRGRVLSLWVIVISGLGPLGGLLVGWSTTVIGAPLTLTICGVIAIIVSGTILLITRSKEKVAQKRH